MMEGRQRVGALVAVPELLRELGVDAGPVLNEAGLSLEDLSNSEGSLPFANVGRLFDSCIAATGCPHFGLLIGQRAGLASLGLVGQLMRHAPDLRQAALDLCVNQPRYVRGSVVYLAVIGDTAFWGYGVHVPDMTAVEHFSEAAVSVGANMMRELTGLGPEDVLLTRRAPADVEPYRRFYGLTPRFEAEQNAVMFPKHLLATPVKGADSTIRAKLEEAVASYWAVAEPTMAQKVSRILRARVIVENATLESVAAELGLHPRTLNRRLKDEGSTFRDLLNDARYEVARQLLRVTRVDIADIGEALGYADPSGFTRAFERWSGLSPSQWKDSSSSHRPA
jgi:AraC-like DNA-binding protein